MKWKSGLLALLTLSLVACGTETAVSDQAATTDSETVEEASQESRLESQESSEEENEADVEEAGSQESDNTESTETSQSETGGQTKSSSASSAEVSEVTDQLQEPADAKDINIIEYVKQVDDSIPEDSSFLIAQIADDQYQVEVRQDSPDGTTSNLHGLYIYDTSSDQVLKQDVATGEFKAIQ